VAASAAAQLAPEPLRGYTSAPPRDWAGAAGPRDPDESPLVRELAARHPNLRPTFLDVRGISFLDHHDELFAAGATPVRNPCNATWYEVLTRDAAADGVGVLLDGGAGNLAFSADDPRWLVALLARGRLLRAGVELRSWSARRGLPLRRVARSSVAAELAPLAVRRWNRVRRGMAAPDASLRRASGLRPEWRGALDLDRHLAFGDERSSRAMRLYGAATLDLLAAQAEFGAAHGARWGLRPTDPTSDVDVLELCAGQPAWFRRRDGYDRAAARAAMAGRVPDSIRLRTRRGAQLPDWADRVVEAGAELADEMDRLRDHPDSRRVVDVSRLGGLVADLPRLGRDADPEDAADYRLALLRSLLASRYLRWFEEQARQPVPVPVTSAW
jgi:asparagine synthase (glutamine-hydrolysing)